MLEILDRLRQEDDSGGDDQSVGDDDVFMEGDDDLGDLGGLDDFDDGGFDDVGGEEAAGGDVGELRNRVDELENEVSSLSSTVNTVRSENQEIAETADEIEENVRKLLDIYEMVTRGVNPFVDDVSHDQDFGTGSLGLFDAEEQETAQGDEELDSSVADADAEDFFDEDFFDEDDAGADAAVSPVGGGESAAGQSPGGGGQAGGGQVGGGDESAADGGGDGDSGKSFAELKAEYENDEADWADEIDTDGTEQPSEADAAAGDGSFEMDDDWGADLDADMSNGEVADAAASPPAPEPDAAPEPDPSAGESDEPGRTESGDLQFAENTLEGTSGMDSKPYVAALPNGYVSDLIVMEWLEYLVDEADTEDAARAVSYYAAIEWIDEDVEESLLTYLRGFGDFGDVEDDPAPTGLTMGHHAQSLQYISRLVSATSEMVVLNQWMADGGGIGGIQR